MVHQGPGKVVCPILLYHRIDIPSTPSEYYTSPDDFRAQMQALKDWGYTPIPISLLVQAINFGADLPARPVILTFDDGDITIYTNAFPIMKAMGYVGVVYIVADRLHADGYLNAEQLKELAAAGWEIGSHSMTHVDLTTIPDATWEIAQSKTTLEKAVGVKIRSFAYPFGLKSDPVVAKTRDYYNSAVGLGPLFTQSGNNIFYLWRRPVKYGWDLKTFGSFLPWNTPPTPQP